MAEAGTGPWAEDQADSYVKSANIVVAERKRFLRIMLDIFGYRFANREGLGLLDLGCGDGSISKLIADRYSNNDFLLVDGSEAMLQRARRNFSGPRVSYRRQTFEEYINSPAQDQAYNFIYSGIAIHHLDFIGKLQLYAKVFRELKFGGLFLNFDMVLPPSEDSERWEFRMWSDWMKEELARGTEIDMGSFLRLQNAAKVEDIPGNAKLKSENKPSGLFDQLQLLTRIGFRDVDCFYKFGVFTLFGGTK
ncbi:MAG: class I SAM-dependent methyltransferase [Nitrososphaerota archaeon]|nr:class I SAM-dependent methyltransferase [Nitrososphaerota archaeon]MDG7049331.1 class I SAM-dependent methyltransferase [Nitrososphaerota archaeon]MDG7052102.1 class I SAM-dependent methyltransferase [Nitrososphaerota archaeon]